MAYDPNDGRRPDILRKRDDGMSGAFMGGIAIALLLLFGAAILALSSRNRDNTATVSPHVEQSAPSSTTGQGGDTRIVPSTPTTPGRD